MKKKLIEVALPLEAINAEAAREKSIRHGHPSTLHLWWARRPLAACRAVLFASLVDDPSSNPDRFPTEEAQAEERERLHLLIELLVDWNNTGDSKALKDLITGHHDEKFRKLLDWDGIAGKTLYEAAYGKILESTKGNPPPVLDPFAGGGSIPLEAQRLGLEAHASDLNPVAVLINKALIEIPPKFKDMPPVNPEARTKIGGDAEWKGTAGLAEDVRCYGAWMREAAFKKIGPLYPKAKLPDGTEARVIAWIWARTVQCPNPACGAEMPLVNSYLLSKKKGKETWVEPLIDKHKKTISFVVHTGKGNPPESPKVGRGATFRCECCGQVARDTHIKSESMAGRMGAKLMAIVTEGTSGRVYLSPAKEHEEIAKSAKPTWKPEQEMNRNTTNLVSGRGYGFFTWGDLFTPRQLTALVTFSDLVDEAIAQAQADALAAGLPADDRGLDAGGNGARAYGEAVGVYLAMLIDKLADLGNALNRWEPNAQCPRQLFARQAIPMVWDFAEGNPLGESSGSWKILLDNLLRSLKAPLFSFTRQKSGYALQRDASNIPFQDTIVISTDPPYYDNIGYADLSDFFYIWLRRSLQKVYPNLFSTMLVPKSEELVATPYRFDGNKEKAKTFFEDGMVKAFKKMRQTVNSDFPLTVYYAYKQSENEEEGETKNLETASSGWETMLQAIIKSGFSITGTWPLRTEMSSRAVAQNTNALASSIAIVCRPRPEDAPSITRRAFQTELREALKAGLRYVQSVHIAPVDLAQASIGPGIGVYSKYREILKVDDTKMTIHDALVMINQELEDYLSTQAGNLDPNSQFCIGWFEQSGTQAGEYGRAETLAKAKLAHIQDLADEGVLESGRGKVRLVKRSELPEDWDIGKAKSIWAMVQGLCLAMDKGGKEGAAAALANIAQANPAAIDNIKSLVYRAYMISERKGWNDEALAYNSLVSMWSDISAAMNRINRENPMPKQVELGL